MGEGNRGEQVSMTGLEKREQDMVNPLQGNIDVSATIRQIAQETGEKLNHVRLRLLLEANKN